MVMLGAVEKKRIQTISFKTIVCFPIIIHKYIVYLQNRFWTTLLNNQHFTS